MVARKVNMLKILSKIKFDTYDNLPLNKQLKVHMLTIIVDLFLKNMLDFIRDSI